MDWIISVLIQNADYAHWVVFGALMLAGMHLPISEDAISILAGALASQVVPENAYKLFLFLFFGAYLSDWLAYWIGRWLGPGLWRLRWFRRLFRKERFDRMRAYYKRYGVATLLIGRMIPCGVRNGLFLTAGMAKMAFPRFLWADAIACFSTVSITFSIGYLFTKNYERALSILNRFDIIIVLIFALVVLGFFWYKRKKRMVRKCSGDLL